MSRSCDVLPPVEAAALMVVPSFVTNLWQAVAGTDLRDLCRRLWAMFPGTVVGTWMGAELLIGEDTARTVAALGIGLAVYAALEGAYELARARASVLALLPAAAGIAAGQRVRARVSAPVFRVCFLPAHCCSACIWRCEPFFERCRRRARWPRNAECARLSANGCNSRASGACRTGG